VFHNCANCFVDCYKRIRWFSRPVCNFCIINIAWNKYETFSCIKKKSANNLWSIGNIKRKPASLAPYRYNKYHTSFISDWRYSFGTWKRTQTQVRRNSYISMCVKSFCHKLKPIVGLSQHMYSCLSIHWYSDIIMLLRSPETFIPIILSHLAKHVTP
jgi:hypothetical protein